MRSSIGRSRGDGVVNFSSAERDTRVQVDRAPAGGFITGDCGTHAPRSHVHRTSAGAHPARRCSVTTCCTCSGATGSGCSPKRPCARCSGSTPASGFSSPACSSHEKVVVEMAVLATGSRRRYIEALLAFADVIRCHLPQRLRLCLPNLWRPKAVTPDRNRCCCAVLNNTRCSSGATLPCRRTQKKIPMYTPTTLTDDTIDRMRETTSRLQDCLVEAAHIRARLTKARAANVWPDLRSGSTLFPDTSAPLRSIRSCDDDRTREHLRGCRPV